MDTLPLLCGVVLAVGLAYGVYMRLRWWWRERRPNRG